MKKLKIYFLVAVAIMAIISCKKEKIDTNKTEITPVDTANIAILYIYNIPINGDTLLLDQNYGIDFRLKLVGYKIDSLETIIDNNYNLFKDSIISTDCFLGWVGTHDLVFIIKATNLTNRKIYYFQTRKILVKFVANFSQRFIKKSIENGRLKLAWPQLDKPNTQYYLLKRSVGENNQFVQEFQIFDSIYIDKYYVGEEANYTISVINEQGGKERIWNYKKEREDPIVMAAQITGNGYKICFSDCKYYNNFGQYKLTTSLNANPSILFTTSTLSDTAYDDPNALFGGEGSYWLRILPKEYPEGVTEQNWEIYSHILNMVYGEKSFQFDCISRIDENNLAFTQKGHIYKFNVNHGIAFDSITNSANYGFLRTTTLGKYLYAADQNVYNSPIYIWSSDKLTNVPKYTFQINFIIPSISDNLIAIMGVNSSTTDSNLALYDITNGNNIFTTSYQATSQASYISSNGNFLFIYNSNLKLCNYKNGILNIIWSEQQFSKSYSFYRFDDVNPDLCYLFDESKTFMIKRLIDFSSISTFKLEIESIINIDSYSRKILGYNNGKLLVYDLDTGTLLNEIPANVIQLVGWGHCIILIGNKIYSSLGTIYDLS